jgi:hypothetical protein
MILLLLFLINISYLWKEVKKITEDRMWLADRILDHPCLYNILYMLRIKVKVFTYHHINQNLKLSASKNLIVCTNSAIEFYYES